MSGSPLNTTPDVLIIGSGMGGAALAYGLKDTGLSVHVLERGEVLPREPENWSVAAVFSQKRYRSVETWTDAQGRIFHPGIHYYVGGNTKVYGACFMRLRPRDFEAVEHHGGLSPAWPIAYADLEPWYGRAETMMGVRGAAGADPTEGPRSTPYPVAPIADDPPIAALAEGMRRNGLQPFPLPSSVQQGAGGGCIRCMTCDGFPCQIDAKGDAEICCMRPALATGHVTLETGARAGRLITTPDGSRIDGVEVEKNGTVEIRRAPIIVVAAGAINSAALLLRSASAAHPRGLANASDLVGRNYMAHGMTAVMSVDPFKINRTVYQKTISVNDYYWGMQGFKWPMGNLQMLGKLQPGMLAAAVPLVPSGIMTALSRRSIEWLVMSEDLPSRDNRVILDGPSLKLVWRNDNLAGHKRLQRELGRVMRALGFPLQFTKRMEVDTTSHQCGTVRMGSDPATSVLDPICKAWEIDNLYVVDGGFLVSSAAVNPALTIAAQALRVADHLAVRLGARVPQREAA